MTGVLLDFSWKGKTVGAHEVVPAITARVCSPVHVQLARTVAVLAIRTWRTGEGQYAVDGWDGVHDSLDLVGEEVRVDGGSLGSVVCKGHEGFFLGVSIAVLFGCLF